MDQILSIHLSIRLLNVQRKSRKQAYMFHNLMTASRALVFPIIILGMRLPLRYHLPTQLVVTLAFTKLNQQLCQQCSSGMQVNICSVNFPPTFCGLRIISHLRPKPSTWLPMTCFG